MKNKSFHAAPTQPLDRRVLLKSEIQTPASRSFLVVILPFGSSFETLLEKMKLFRLKRPFLLTGKLSGLSKEG